MVSAALRCLDFVLCRLSFAGARRLGAWLGLVWFHVVRIRRPTTIRQIAGALGVPTPAARRIARDLYRHLGICAVELLRLEDAASTVRVSGLERFEAARARGRGVVVVTAHFGNWDLCAASQAMRGVRLHVVTKDLVDRGVNALWMSRRRRAGVVLHAAKGSMRSLLAALRAGETVGLVVDQATPGGVVLPFFGRPAETSATPAVLAARTGAAMLPVFLFRDEDGTGHELRIGEEIEVGDVATTLARIHAELEAAIRERPELWLWLHRRWKVSGAQRGAAVAGAAVVVGAAVPGAAEPVVGNG